MVRALTLSADFTRIAPADWLRASIVYSCAVALIIAGPLLPHLAG